ncbi:MULTISPECIES: PTS ascorbate transporter subunit IIC [Aerococcus]|uniref:Ascorbate-specific PTS system EIIC component n=1 Tax=Aerococcus tenax TaxID=3078812 RepID=A0A5N1BXB2_9LACT|nr:MULTISPECIES: PTS ascorbate transporter subunit IIC [Aerococcus]KAA9242073.1 PTS ascorbate transporter subunit IIC [Aerococcus urinae]MCY3036272.1 PTS ascorbate transporter subunit IIC [Aerococcus sp. Group 2]MDK6520286.1 PTS ascorbate transporter subunit IIC [Aerococcus urinae]MDK7302805.1 PTS ascorbate transporter subunit IIC [Aerococcus urinae]MDK7801412.1 PTS ascorbate transporter subunit IIC [Aerococcus urinae]
MLNFIYSFFNQPAMIIGLIALIGLVVQRSSFNKILVGTSKTVIGFLIMSLGGGIISETLGTLSPAFENAFNVQGVIPNNEAVIGVAQNMLGTELALVMGFGFVFNILIARFTKLKYIFLTGHHVLFMAALITAVLGTAGFHGVELIAIGSFILGSCMVLSPAIVQPFYREVTGSDDIAMGHFNALSYSLTSVIAKVVGNKEKSTEDVDVPDKFSFMRDSTITTAIVMVIIYLIVFLSADSNLVLELSNGDNILMFAIVEGLKFTAGFVIVLQGVRMMLAEIIPAFQGISEKIVPEAVPALDVPVLFPYGQNAVIIGFLSTLVGAFIVFLCLPFTNLPLIIPGLIPIFFVGAGAGVLNNAQGGIRGTVIGGLINGALLILLPAFMLPLLGDLGFTNTTFGDVDFAFVGIVLGHASQLFSKTGIYTIVVALIAFFVVSAVLPSRSSK